MLMLWLSTSCETSKSALGYRGDLDDTYAIIEQLLWTRLVVGQVATVGGLLVASVASFRAHLESNCLMCWIRKTLALSLLHRRRTVSSFKLRPACLDLGTF
jgi:hypothetical protein